MSAPIPPAESTQPISQSYYEIIIQRGKSLHLPAVEKEENPAETQRTLNEGDHGHVDIVSSFVTGEKDEEKSDREDAGFSPTQSQHNLTQYPESERFKTPATAGRKRDYNGNPVETPSLPRNPLRNGEPTPSRMMGLSQAFAGTQAGSSPFLNGLPTIARSDRPSPNVELQARPASASDSSPWRPLSDFKRAVTEPAARYVPMKQSQAHRVLQALPDVETCMDQDEADDDDDGFKEEPSCVTRTRRRKQREDQAQKHLLRISTVVSPPTISSPVPVGLLPVIYGEIKTRVIEEDDQYISHSDSTRIENDVSSETATDRENVCDIASRECSSEVDDSNDNNKENQAIDVPRTVTARRLHDIINGSISQIDASPLAGHADLTSPEVTMPSSALQAVPNSQPGDERKKHRDMHRTSVEPRNLAKDINIRLEQGNHAPTFSSAMQLDNHASSDVDMILDRTSPCRPGESLPTRPSSNPSLHFLAGSTIPETSSELAGKMLHTPHEEPHGNDDEKQPPGDERTMQFDNVSSQPIRATPPGRRRRRMFNSSAEPSPTGHTPIFDAREALQLDGDEEIIAMLAPSPSRKQVYRASHTSKSHDLAISSSHAVGNPLSSPVDDAGRVPKARLSLSRPQSDKHGQDLIDTNYGQQDRLARGNMPSSSSASQIPIRKSIWEIETTPVESAHESFDKGHKPRQRKSLRAQHQDAGADAKYPSHVAPADPVTSGVNVTTTKASESLIAPNMVFACFNGKVRAYYPAVCLGSIGDDTKRLLIQWEGYEPDEVDIHGVRPLDLRIGDTVKVNLNKYPKTPFLIQGFKDQAKPGSNELTDVRGFKTLLIVPKRRKNLATDRELMKCDEVPVKAVYLDNNMWGQMKNRSPELTGRNSDHHLSDCQTPIGRDVTPTTPSSRRRQQLQSGGGQLQVATAGLFASMAFAISYEDAERKDMLAESIRSRGGVVIGDSFPELFESETIHLKSAYLQVGFTALLAESYSRKEKYMQALALGLPCLSGRWIEKCVEKNILLDWQTYLLPAGESAELDGAARSRILPTMSTQPVLLTQTIARRGKLLHGLCVIVVMGRGKAEVKRAKYVFLLRALGAEKIEKVPDLKSAQDLVQSDPNYSWVFVDDKDVETGQELFAPAVGTSRTGKRTTISGRVPGVAGQETIVQSLILGQWSHA